MDILRKELEEIYERQRLGEEQLSQNMVEECCALANAIIKVSNGCAVVTDASCDRCFIYSGFLGVLMGYSDEAWSKMYVDSSDEDIIYGLIHPEDLVDKRLLEYEFFNYIDGLSPAEKLSHIAKCTIRMKSADGSYRAVDNTTQVISLSTANKIWLILCTYQLSTVTNVVENIAPIIINLQSGEVMARSFQNRRANILSTREKEVLQLIKEGKLSKQIADILGISIHTVNRHRQNIIEKLSVSNSVEAVTAATLMRLL